MIIHKTANIYIDANGHVRFAIVEDAVVNLTDVKEYVQILEDICAGTPRCLIIDTRKTSSTITNEARKFMGSNSEVLRWRKADAILLDSFHVRIIGNFYMNFDTPSLPVKMFTDEVEATKWLENF